MNKFSILIAEDDKDDQVFIRDAFERNCGDCSLEFVNNGLELTDHLETSSLKVPPYLPSAILLDLNMPLKDGYQALKEIKQTPHLRHIPVIVVTSSTRGTEEEYCKSLGCSHFYNKPDSIADYDTLIHKIIYSNIGTAGH